MKIKDTIDKINNTIATKATLWIGTMWAVYAFAILVAIPLVFPATNMVIMYISSSFLQLVFLPLIMVGNNILNAKTDERAQEDHQMLMDELAELKEMHQELKLTLNMNSSTATIDITS